MNLAYDRYESKSTLSFFSRMVENCRSPDSGKAPTTACPCCTVGKLILTSAWNYFVFYTFCVHWRLIDEDDPRQSVQRTPQDRGNSHHEPIGGVPP